MIDGNFKVGNTNNVELKNFDALPTSNYPLRMIGAEVKGTKAGTGHYLNCEFEVIDGNYRGRRVFQKYNFDNPSADAVNICLQDFMRWLAACGMPVEGDIMLNHVLALEGKPFLARVRFIPGRDGNDDSNEIKGYKPLPTGSVGTAPAPQAFGASRGGSSGGNNGGAAGGALPSFMS